MTLRIGKQRGRISADTFIISGLMILAFVPSIGGSFRVAQLLSGADATPETARFFAQPLPVLLHIVGAVVYAIMGAFQFAPNFRQNHPRWHRVMGRVLIPAGFIVALSGLWMTQFYPWPALDGVVLYSIRWGVGVAMTAALVLGVLAIRRWDIKQHKAWMMRAYALAMGAGTQVFTHIPLAIFPDQLNETTRAIAMGAGWAINVLIAELIIQRSAHAARSS